MERKGIYRGGLSSRRVELNGVGVKDVKYLALHIIYVYFLQEKDNNAFCLSKNLQAEIILIPYIAPQSKGFTALKSTQLSLEEGWGGGDENKTISRDRHENETIYLVKYVGTFPRGLQRTLYV